MSVFRSLGGISLTTFDQGDGGAKGFASAPYMFFSVALSDGQAFNHQELDGYSIFCLTAEPGAVVQIAGAGQRLSVMDSAVIENNLSVQAVGGSVELLVAGSTRSAKRPTSIEITPADSHYKVVKPWGHELWINGEDPDFCFKEVCITTCNRTSLQYHNLKRETNLLVGGVADIVYKTRDEVALDDVTDNDLGSERVYPLAVLDVKPLTLHRIVAVSDVMLYEVSTPHLDDVIRVQDDTNRTDGRVVVEHFDDVDGAVRQSSTGTG